MRIVEEPWKDFDGSQTRALSIVKEGQYTISELIELLEEAKKQFGDKKIYFHEMNRNVIGGFSYVYLHHGFEEENSICIYG